MRAFREVVRIRFAHEVFTQRERERARLVFPETFRFEYIAQADHGLYLVRHLYADEVLARNRRLYPHAVFRFQAHSDIVRVVRHLFDGNARGQGQLVARYRRAVHEVDHLRVYAEFGKRALDNAAQLFVILLRRVWILPINLEEIERRAVVFYVDGRSEPLRGFVFGLCFRNRFFGFRLFGRYFPAARERRNVAFGGFFRLFFGKQPAGTIP